MKLFKTQQQPKGETMNKDLKRECYVQGLLQVRKEIIGQIESAFNMNPNCLESIDKAVESYKSLKIDLIQIELELDRQMPRWNDANDLPPVIEVDL